VYDEQLAAQAALKLSEEEYAALSMREYLSGKVTGFCAAIKLARKCLADQAALHFMLRKDEKADLYRQMTEELQKVADTYLATEEAIHKLS